MRPPGYNFKDMTNARVGRVTVMKRGQNTDGNAIWICLCDCGKLCAVSGSLLRATMRKAEHAGRPCTYSCPACRKGRKPTFHNGKGQPSVLARTIRETLTPRIDPPPAEVGVQHGRLKPAVDFYRCVHCEELVRVGQQCGCLFERVTP